MNPAVRMTLTHKRVVRKNRSGGTLKFKPLLTVFDYIIYFLFFQDIFLSNCHKLKFDTIYRNKDRTVSVNILRKGVFRGYCYDMQIKRFKA